MKMSDLILAVGDEHVVFQNLLNDAQSIDKTKHGTKITFYTDAIQAEELLFGQTKKIGLVVWLPRDRVEAAMVQERRATSTETTQSPERAGERQTPVTC